MNDNPYSSPKPFHAAEKSPAWYRLLWFGSAALIGIGLVLTLTLFGCAIADAINGWGQPLANAFGGVVVATIFGILGVPQYYSVFKRSPRAAVLVQRICVVGFIIAAATAVIYPIAEYHLSNSPAGFEILGAVFYSFLAFLFMFNRWMQKKWLRIINPPNGT